MICVSMGYPTAEEEIEILKREQSIEKTRERIDPVVNAEELIEMQREVKEVLYMTGFRLYCGTCKSNKGK